MTCLRHACITCLRVLGGRGDAAMVPKGGCKLAPGCSMMSISQQAAPDSFVCSTFVCSTSPRTPTSGRRKMGRRKQTRRHAPVAAAAKVPFKSHQHAPAGGVRKAKHAKANGPGPGSLAAGFQASLISALAANTEQELSEKGIKLSGLRPRKSLTPQLEQQGAAPSAAVAPHAAVIPQPSTAHPPRGPSTADVDALLQGWSLTPLDSKDSQHPAAT